MISTERAALERLVGGTAGQQPAAQGHQRDHQHGRDEDAGDPVGQPLDAGLLVLGVLHQPHHVGELGVAPDPGGLDLEVPTGRDGAADHRIAHRRRRRGPTRR